jgi:hypothetical protein
VAHVTQCPRCICGRTRAARALGVTEEEMAEVIFCSGPLHGTAMAYMKHSGSLMPLNLQGTVNALVSEIQGRGCDSDDEA